MNLKLKFAIVESGKSQVAIAKAVGLSESRMSRIVNEWGDPSQEEKDAIAAAVGKPVEELFTETAA